LPDVRIMMKALMPKKISTPTSGPASNGKPDRDCLDEKRRNRPQRLQQREARSRDETGQRVVLPRRLEHHACVPIM
jgi:hypothetical protein